MRPQVSNRSRFELGALQAKARGGVFPSAPYIPLTEHLVLSLVVDLPSTMATLPWEKCELWGVSRQQALSVAVENLARMSRERFVRQGALFVSPWQDNYDAARLTLIETLAELPVKGRPVALAPHRDHLFLTGSEDEAGLAQLADQAERLSAEPRFMGFYPVILEEAGWRTFHLAEGHPLSSRYRLLEMQQWVRLYGEQKELLEAVLEKEERDLFVATFKAIHADGRIFSYAVWTKGVHTLLPRTDRVVLLNPEETEVQPLDVPWEVLQRYAGDAFVLEAGLYPERYAVKGFPSDEALAALRQEVGP
jgi:hypothetical protein